MRIAQDSGTPMQGMYEVTGWAGGSRVDGDAAAIAFLQRSSAH